MELRSILGGVAVLVQKNADGIIANLPYNYVDLF